MNKGPFYPNQIVKSLTNSKYYPWVVVALLGGVALLNYMDRQMLSTMKDSMQVDIIDLQSATNFGRLMAIFLWVYGLMSPISGIIADNLSRKKLIVGSLLVWSSVTYLMGLATTYDQVFWLRALMGVSEALYLPAGLSLIADYHTGGSRSLAVGIHMTGLYLGQAIGGFGATLAAAYSWNTTFYWFGIIGIVYAFVLAVFLKDKKRVAPEEAKESTPKKPQANVLLSLKSLFTNPAFWVILLYFAIPSLPGWATKNWLPTLFAESLGLPMSQAGPMATITIAFSSFVGVVFGGILSDRWVRKNIKGRIYTGAIGLSLTIPSLLLLGFGSSLFEVVTAGVLFGIGFGMFDANNMPILCQFVSVRQRATAYGVMNMVGVFAGAMITSVLGSWSDDGNLGMGFALLAAVVAVAVVIQLYSLRPQTDDKE